MHNKTNYNKISNLCLNKGFQVQEFIVIWCKYLRVKCYHIQECLTGVHDFVAGVSLPIAEHSADNIKDFKLYCD